MQNITQQEITSIASKKWDEMNEEKKRPYVITEKQEKERYEAQLVKYYEKNPEEQQKQLDKQAKKLKKQEEKQKEKE